VRLTHSVNVVTRNRARSAGNGDGRKQGQKECEGVFHDCKCGTTTLIEFVIDGFRILIL
jgi:hypothetical protein